MVTIYMPLLNEGTDAWRPVAAIHVGTNHYRIEGIVPADEEWKFPSGSVVACELRNFAGGERRLTAIKQVDA